MKSHLIYYNKIYENLNLNDIHMEVKKKLSSENGFDSNSDSSCYSKIILDKNNKQDALILEYCPRIFRELRRIDDISNEEIQQ